MARIRTFIAVDIGTAIRQRALALQEKLARSAPDVKWVEESNLHITLLFLGEVDPIDVVSICRIVKQQANDLPLFSLEIGGVGAFPTPRRPKVLWAGIKQGEDELRSIHASLEAPLLELGCYRREERGYNPHLTLGRINKEDANDAWGSIIAQHASWEGGITTVDEILIMSSENRRRGPEYTVMGRAPLGG